MIIFPLSCSWCFSSSSILYSDSSSGSGLGLGLCSDSGLCLGSDLNSGLDSGRVYPILDKRGSLDDKVKEFNIYNI